MPPADEREEQKVQKALALLREKNPGMKIAEAARRTRTSYDRVRRRKQGHQRSSSRGGYNKKLNISSSSALKECLLIYYRIGHRASIDHVITFTNSILQYNKETGTVYRR